MARGTVDWLVGAGRKKSGVELTAITDTSCLGVRMYRCEVDASVLSKIVSHLESFPEGTIPPLRTFPRGTL